MRRCAFNPLAIDPQALMTVRSRTFTSADHDALHAYLLKLMAAVREGLVHPEEAAGDLDHLLAAVDVGNFAEPLARADHCDEFIAHLANRRPRANAP